MWPSQREAIAVWADALQVQGEPLGELVALSLRAEEVRDRKDAREAEELARAAEAMRLDHAEELLGPAIGELPRLRLRWRFGLVRDLFLDLSPTLANPPTRVVLEVVVKLLERPVLRHVDRIHLEALELDRELEAELLRELGDPRCQARPRRLVLGRMPGQFRTIVPCPDPGAPLARRPGIPPPARELLDGASERGLSWLVRWGLVQSLPWAPGDHGSRLQALERLLTRPWTPAAERLLGRALWDSSLRVRRRVLEALPELPDEAAPLLLATLAIHHHSNLAYGDRVRRCLTQLGRRFEWLAALADEFCAEEPWAARWLASLPRPTAGEMPAITGRARERVRAMLDRRSLLRARSNQRDVALRRAYAALGGEDPGFPHERRVERATLDDETVAELLEKLGQRRGAP